MDVTVEIDELVLDGDADGEELADRIRAATMDALDPATAALVGRAVLDVTSEQRGSAGVRRRDDVP